MISGYQKSQIFAFLGFLILPSFLSIPANAFSTTDLTTIDTSSFAEGEWLARKKKERILFLCQTCSDQVILDIQLQKAPDRTEDRIRSGQTTEKKMFDICKQNAAKTGSKCFSLKNSNIGKAVGFVTSTQLPNGTYTNTRTLWQDGKLMLVRAIAPSTKTADQVGAKAFNAIVKQIAN